ncbi:MAG: 50S ribosomal protein L4 [Deltaproteobacteria bacterium]|jgi:large subunit ribosomal protein L4|nr:50S ribosomal protein L4 [Deltaproteobacteria bacterium]
MQIDVVDMQGQKVGQMDLADEVFAAEVREALLWEVVKAQQARKRKGTHSTKTRQFARGGGKKPYRQKGTGNARQGSSRSPNFVGGGKVFGPHPRSYAYALPRKVRKAALAAALSLRVQEKKLVVVDKLVVEAPKSKRIAAALKTLGFDSALVVDAKGNENLVKSIRNLTAHACLPPEGLNVYDILKHGGLIIARDAIRAVEARVVGTPAEGQAA